jgi:hypothetical protein
MSCFHGTHVNSYNSGGVGIYLVITEVFFALIRGTALFKNQPDLTILKKNCSGEMIVSRYILEISAAVMRGTPSLPWRGAAPGEYLLTLLL